MMYGLSWITSLGHEQGDLPMIFKGGERDEKLRQRRSILTRWYEDNIF